MCVLCGIEGDWSVWEKCFGFANWLIVIWFPNWIVFLCEGRYVIQLLNYLLN